MKVDNPTKKVFFFTCIVVVALFVVFTPTMTHRSLDETALQIDKIDSRAMCAGPRHGSKNDKRGPFHSQAIYGLELGNKGRYGQLNNMIVEMVNAVDAAMSSDGKAVVVVSGWTVEWMKEFFPDDESWVQLGREFPIVVKNSIQHLALNLESIGLPTEKYMSRKGHEMVEEKDSWDVIHARRVKLFHYMFSSLHGEACEFYHQTIGFLGGKFNTKKYVSVHVRNMDGRCNGYNANRFHEEQCEKSPAFLKSIIDLYPDSRKLPMVIMTDMQNETKIHNIQDNLPQVVVPQWDFAGRPSMIADLVLGVMSEVFIGENGSSGSRNIGIIREAFGKDVTTSYVFLNKTEDGQWKNFYPHHPYQWFVWQDEKQRR